MKTATATYVAPFGENKVVEFGGLTFHDGKPVEINDHDNTHVFNKLQNHTMFNFKMGSDKTDEVKPPVKRGRPSFAQKAAAQAASEEADRAAKEATEKAKTAKADLDEVKKASEAKVEPGYTPPEQKTNVSTGMAEATGHDFEKDRQDEIARRANPATPGLPGHGITDAPGRPSGA